MERFKTIAVFTYPSEYAVLNLLLEQEGLRYVFQNETMVSVLPFHSNAFGGIRLRVHEDDAMKAIAIIKKLNATSFLKIV
ncbi:MAG: hypothetical protein CMC08_00465 [Flavobacteriaceae bacterium]|nr:hypothetical protein [Flavobacteriaceae bacterium]|tara:strand:+ start:363 stop:602 length:240 start_codon:yes stop_codon:yes gene_type:complete